MEAVETDEDMKYLIIMDGTMVVVRSTGHIFGYGANLTSADVSNCTGAIESNNSGYFLCLI